MPTVLSGWYDRDSPQEQQAMRTGLLPAATTDEWFAMGWATKQVTRVARRLLMARARWIDGITVHRKTPFFDPKYHFLAHKGKK